LLKLFPTSSPNINSHILDIILSINNTITMEAITTIEVNGLKKIASGKVREIFEIDEKTLLFVATDRISAYDVILQNVCEYISILACGNHANCLQGVPNKGALLTQLSGHWFELATTVHNAHCPLNDRVRSACRMAHTLVQSGLFSKAMEVLDNLSSEVSRVLKMDQKVKAFAALVQFRRRMRQYVMVDAAYWTPHLQFTAATPMRQNTTLANCDLSDRRATQRLSLRSTFSRLSYSSKRNS
jgi:hypothetical protein